MSESSTTRQQKARIPVRVHNRPDGFGRGPSGVFVTLSTRDAEFYDCETDSDPLGFLPAGFAAVGTLANPVLDAFRERGHEADQFGVADGERETVAYANIYGEPGDDGWIEFEFVGGEKA